MSSDLDDAPKQWRVAILTGWKHAYVVEAEYDAPTVMSENTLGVTGQSTSEQVSLIALEHHV